MKVLRAFLIAFGKGAAFVAGGMSMALFAVTVSGLTSFKTGDLISATSINANFEALRSAVAAVPDHYAAKGAGGGSIPFGGVHIVPMSSELLDTNNMLTAGDNGITIQSAGVYLIVAELDFQNNTTGQRFLRLYADAGALQEFGDDPYSSTNTHLEGSGIHYLNVGQVVTLRAEQASGVALNAGGTLAVVKLSD